MKPSAVMQRLMLSSIPLERSQVVDLHGQSAKSARARVLKAVEEAVDEGITNLTVVTGRGNHSNPNGSRAVLFNQFPKWIKDEETATRIKDVKMKTGAYELNIVDQNDKKKNKDSLEMKKMLNALMVIQDGGIDAIRERAQKGHPRDQVMMGHLCFEGEHVNRDLAEGVKWLKQAADQRYLTAEIALAGAYEDGEGVRQDFKKAVKWYGKAIAKREVNPNAPPDILSRQDALTRLAKCYLLGQGVDQSDDEAMRLLHEAAELHCPYAQLNLAQIYESGQGAPLNDEKANKWYLAAAEQGIVTAQVNLAKRFFFGWGIAIDYTQSFKWFNEAANAGDMIAQFYLGHSFANGLGVKSNDEKAAYWFFKSAEQGDADAQLKIGYAYWKGIGIKADLTQALKWLNMAADKNNRDAAYVLGLIHCRNAKNVQGNDKETLDYFRKAANLGHLEAQKYLGLSYLRGIGVSRDLQEAKRWFTEPAKQDDALAQFMLGTVLDMLNDPKESAEAIRLYKRAAGLGFSSAQVHLGIYYFKGFDVQPNIATARSYFRQAADQKDNDGLYHLAMLSSEDRDIPKDFKLVVACLSLASSQGHTDSMSALAYYVENGIDVSKNISEAIRLHKAAANDGNTHSQLRLGYLFLKGEGVAIDLAEALKWYSLAAEQNDPEGQLQTGILLLKKDDKSCQSKGLQWLFSSANQECERAEFLVATLYAEGKLIGKDERLAVEWFEKSANHGNAQAAFQMSGIYREGFAHIKPDKRQTVEWLTKAAELGHPVAQKLMTAFHQHYQRSLAALQQKPSAPKGPDQFFNEAAPLSKPSSPPAVKRQAENRGSKPDELKLASGFLLPK